MRTLGIDLSADPARTGACQIDWSAETVSFVGTATDEALVAAAVSSDMTANDVPLGWPGGFVEAVVAHHHGNVAGREGWIHVPTAGVAEIGGDSAA